MIVVPPEREWLGVQECRVVSGRGVGRIREALRSGELRGYQDGKGGHWHVHRSDLNAWMRGEVAPVVVPDVTKRRAS
jgi:excisionase family DNA binding protein